MRFTGVETGSDFEHFIIGGLLEAGLTVHDTPTAGDYGADLVFDYRGARFVGQCKYYTKPVGLQAVQEVIGALGYYGAAYGIVFTNASFTQQAKNLADSNNILLLDGTALVNFTYDKQGIPILDEFIQHTNHHGFVPAVEQWIMNDLVARYGISAQKIIKDCLSRGLPYYKVGREYRFDPDEVKNWEISQQYIPVGHKDLMELPAFRTLRLKLIHAYRDAKKQGNKEKARELKQTMQRHDIRYSNRWLPVVLLLIGFISLMLILLWATGQIS